MHAFACIVLDAYLRPSIFPRLCIVDRWAISSPDIWQKCDKPAKFSAKSLKGLGLAIADFASLWLCTHIGEFQERYPDIALSILTPRRLDEASNPEVDVYIAFGEGNWPNRAVELLSEVEFTPLCSPVLLNKVGGLAEPADVLRVPLLHLVDFDDWMRWLALAGVESPDPEMGIVFSDMNLLLSATTAGQGIAMGDELTCRRALETGQVVRPFDLAIKSTRAYYLVTEAQKGGQAVIGAFRDWLRARLAETAAVIRPAR
jgi:LysR family glycine cleavage system transcriptional activator